jgi:hypothetical protein
LRLYLAGLSFGRLVLWWYFIWYVVVLVRYFDPNPRLWLTALGLSVIIGSALLINTTASGSRRVHLESWPAVRLYLFPFCVSSFSSLVKGRDFFLVFSPRLIDLLLALGLCGLFWLAVVAVKVCSRRPAAEVERPAAS